MAALIEPAIADLLHDALIVRDLDGRILQWNRAAAEKYQYSPTEAIGRNLHELLNTTYLGENADDALRADGSWEGEVRVRRRDGRVLLTPCRLRSRGRQVVESHGPTDLRTEAELSLVIDNMPGLVSYIDAKLRYRFANRVYADWFSTTVDGVVGSFVEDVLGPEAFAQVRGYMERALAGERVHYETFLPYALGSAKYVSVTYAPDRDPDTGEVCGFISLVEDVSARYQAEQALRASESFYRQIIETAHEGIWIIGLEAQTEFANERMADLLGTTAEAMRDRHAFDYVFPDEVGEAQALFAAKLEGDREPFEFRLRRADGHPIWVRISGVPLRDADGAVTGVLGMFSDITASRDAEQTLHDREEQLRKLLNNLPDVIARFDRQGRFLYVSPAVEVATGLQPESFLGRTHLEAGVAPELASYLEGKLFEIFESGKSATVDFEMPGPTGANRIYHGLGVPEFTDEGGVATVLTIVHDVTEQRRTEEALRRSNTELEQFAYAAAHDLQEPLRGIGIYTQLYLRRYGTSADPGAEKAAGFILSAVRRMEALVSDLLAYSRVVHEPSSLSTASLDEALDEGIAALDSGALPVNARIERTPLPVVWGEPRQLAQVFQNLLSNAFKYRKTGEPPVINISARRTGSEWTITVHDNGIGFHPKYAEQIFGLFKRLHRDEYPGTGVGLGICRRILERHGGRIWAESEGEGHGATLRFTLRAVD